MAKIEIYSAKLCAYCRMAERLLDSKGAEYELLHVDADDELMRQMIERSQRRTTPQIFIDDKHIGGFSELEALNKSGELESLLTG